MVPDVYVVQYTRRLIQSTANPSTLPTFSMITDTLDPL
jgi:hypothetical protein